MPSKLNSSQAEAVNTESGPMLVLAGAGSGKTRVITHRIARLIRRGVEPQRIWAVTFTNKAAREMRERICQLVGKRLQPPPVVSTFHAYCVQILRRQIFRLGYPARFPIYDQSDQTSLARRVLREIKVDDAQLKPSDLLFLISGWKSRGWSPRDAASSAESNRDHLAAAAYRRYQKALEQTGAVDFDDLLLCTTRVLREFPEALQEESARFDHILVDEYQDTNGPQYHLVKSLAERHRNLCVVGDDDQSIYAWRGADLTYILNFPRDWPDAKVVRLVDNYRCTGEILACANRLIAFNTTRYDKTLRAARPAGEKPKVQQFDSTEKEAAGVVQDIARRVTQPGVTPGDFAILFRTNEQTRAFEIELRKQKLPYTLIGGRSFFDVTEVKDVLAFLSLIDVPREEHALRRMINIPARGIGEKSLDILLDAARERECALWSVIDSQDLPTRLTKLAARGVRAFAELINKYHRAVRSGQAALHTSLSDFLREVHYEAELIVRFPDPDDRDARMRTVEDTVNALAGYEQENDDPSLRGFLDEMALGMRDFGSEKDKEISRNCVTLLTMHAAKGLEYPEVYLVGMEDGTLPHKRSLQDGDQPTAEERRLCYVGITRAQERLTFTMALARMKWGKPRPTIPSPFLYEALGMAERATDQPRRPHQKACTNSRAQAGG